MAKCRVITGPGGPQKGRHQEGISASRNPKAILVVVDVGRFPAQRVAAGMQLLHSGGHSKSLHSLLALLADGLYTSYICHLRISSTHLGGLLLEAEEKEVAKPSFPVP